MTDVAICRFFLLYLLCN